MAPVSRSPTASYSPVDGQPSRRIGQLGPGVIHRLRARTRSPHDPGPLRREQHVPPWQQPRGRPSGRRGPTVVHGDHAGADDNDGYDLDEHDDHDNVARPGPDVDKVVVLGESVRVRSACDFHGHRDTVSPVGLALGGRATTSGRGWFGDVQRRRHGPGDGRRRGWWASDVHYLVPVSGCAHDRGDVRWHGYGGTEQRHDYPTGQRTSTADDATGLDSPGHPLAPPGDQRAHTCLDRPTLKRWCQEPGHGRNKVGCGHDHPSRRRKPRFC